MSATVPAALKPPRVGIIGQVIAWLSAVVLSWYGFQGLFAEWSTDLALLTLGWLLLGIFAWLFVREPRTTTTNPTAASIQVDVSDVVASVVIAAIALGLSIATAWPLWSMPPAYHDEYSYLFQAETLLSGRFSWPGPSPHSELFDQMHVLNEGRMASRYYPGTGLWMAPWLAAGVPYLGHWMAGAISAALVYWIARELSDRMTGWIAGLAFAAAPGPALFGNLLLAHHPTLLSLLVFTWAFLRAMRTNHFAHWLVAGTGLAAAMLCRPATAAGFAFPFGVWALIRLWSPESRSRVRLLIGLGMPLMIGLAVMLLYNHSVTGDWLKSPYQLYTEIYTPRHVFGLNNVVRGEQHLGPKVLQSYDEWAENLTPSKAWQNVLYRLIATAYFTIDLPLMLVTLVLTATLWMRMSAGWKLVAVSILTQHALHWLYWFAGIFGWHYVYETGPLWCLLLGYVGRCLYQTWNEDGRKCLPYWVAGLLVITWLGMYVDAGEAWTPRWRKGVGEIAYSRRQHAAFRDAIRRDVTQLPALVLVDGKHDGQQIDFVTNHAGLTAPVLIGRDRQRPESWNEIAAAFPERNLYLFHTGRGNAELIHSATQKE